MVTAAKWWHTEDNVVVCDLCPRECRLHEGQRAFCFVRQNVGGEMVLTTYGKSTGFCIDPIEKKPLNHFLPGTPILSFGTAGCNLGCKFCQNWDISKSREIERLSESAGPDAIVKAAVESGCRSVAFTYNDPVVWAEYAIDTARACREAGIKTVAVTAGYITPAARPEFYSVMDAANVDLKAFTEAFYKYLTFSKLEPVLDTLRWLKHESDVWFEITNLVIPEENDSPDEIAQMCDWILGNVGDQVPVHFTAFHPDFRLQNRPATPHETLIRAQEQAIAAGLKYVYTGNVNDVKRQSTYCHGCGKLVIERNWYELGQYKLAGNQCGHCGTVVPGVFEDRPGVWGRRRQPVRIREAAPQELIHIQPAPMPPIQTRTEQPVSPKIDFTDEEGAAVVQYARDIVDEAVRGNGAITPLDSQLANAPGFGAFVTLKRGALLRACRGRWGGTTPLGLLLTQVAKDTARNDPRFPSIHPDELDDLDVEVSLMYAPRPLTSVGAARAADVVVGRHGLVIAHPRGRGLLLPQVAVEAGWNAGQFLIHVCRKAGLPDQTWLDPATQLMTFEARVFEQGPRRESFDVARLSQDDVRRLFQLVSADWDSDVLEQCARSVALATPYPEKLAICLENDWGGCIVETAIGSSLFELAARAGRGYRETYTRPGRPMEQLERLYLMSVPISLQPGDSPERMRSLWNAAVIAEADADVGLVLPNDGAGVDKVGTALDALGQSREEWKQSRASAARITAFSVQSFVDSTQTRPEVRPAARAGSFYPADPAVMSKAIDDFLAAGAGPRGRVKAVMLPHAGWFFCGQTIGKTLSRIEVPRTVLLIGARHTPDGPQWSVSAADRWQIPGTVVPVATDYCRRLTDLVPGLAREQAAHQAEHSIEVLVPFLHHRNPKLQIIPVVAGNSGPEHALRFGTGIARLMDEIAEEVLIVISSDMNHFAPEEENRRRDLLAIDAMLTGDPDRLYATVHDNDISMCGVFAAAVAMHALRQNHPQLAVELVDYSNSAAASRDRNRVVGYAGVLLN